ncbi:MAG: hypothetical protein K0R94_972 [Burkholderiales bacterium]|jgi:hypothetical protein|nr:hypothetical protein [Burkholderiales bacterium]
MKILFFILLSFLTINTFAVPRPTIHLIHINGIDTDFEEAGQNLTALKKQHSN